MHEFELFLTYHEPSKGRRVTDLARMLRWEVLPRTGEHFILAGAVRARVAAVEHHLNNIGSKIVVIAHVRPLDEEEYALLASHGFRARDYTRVEL